MNSIPELVNQLAKTLLQHQWHCVVAESCTGGALAAAMTEVAGSSQWFERGFVTYSNESKMELLGVSEDVISSYGAVSEETVCAMAQGALHASHAEVSVAISGVAGPGGGSLDKPVGTVWIAWASKISLPHAQCYVFKGDRHSIRQQAVQVALEGLIEQCERP